MKKFKLLLPILGLLLLGCLLAGCGDRVDPVDDIDGEKVRTLEITDEFFVFERYEVVTTGPDKVGDQFSIFTTNTVNIYTKCLSTLEEVSAVIDFYDVNGKLVGTYKASSYADIPANTEFVLSSQISDNVRDNFSIVKVKYSGVTRSKEVYRISTFFCNITYIYNNGDAPKMEVVEWKQRLERPTDPKKDGYTFNGWYTDPECTQLFDFENTIISDDYVLYADFSIDYERMGQMVQATARDTTVKITTKSYTSLIMGMIEITSHTKSGEGVIIKDSSGYYYVLTTEDLVEKRKGYENVSYIIEDSFGNTYSASLKHSNNSYNLAVLYFEKGAYPLGVAAIANVVPSVGEDIVVAEVVGGVAAPNFGKVISYDRIIHSKLETNAEDIKYNMMVHNARTDLRVSGRPVFGTTLGLVGLQCGTLTEQAVENNSSHAIPLEAIRKYLEVYGL